MAYELLMPQLGLTMEEGTVSQWIKKEGDAVKVGDVIVEITTDKLTNEVVSETEGVMLKIVAQEGDDIPVMGTLAWIGQPGEAVGGAAAPVAEAAPVVPFAPAPVAPAKNAADTSIIVLGGGPGGYTAALYAARAGLKAVVFERASIGGQIISTHLMENYPGFPEGISGIDFAENLKEYKYQSSDWSHGEHPFVVEESDIDDLVEEMVGDGNA